MKAFIRKHLFSFFKYFPWYLLLWPLFYAFNINAAYKGVIAQDEMWIQILKWQLLLVAVFFFFRVFFSNNIQPAILTVWLGFLFFYIQGLKVLLSKYHFLHPLDNIYYIVSFWIILTIALFVFFIKIKNKFLKLSQFMMYLFIVLTFYEGINYIIIISKRQTISFKEKYRPARDNLTASVNDSSLYPNIYHLVFDSYTNAACFKKQFNYDNSILDSSLKEKGFYVSNNSKSNYFDSPVSVASIFNMNYLPGADVAGSVDELTYFCGLRNLDNNTLWNFLQQKGYTIYNESIFKIKNHPTNLKTIYFGNTDHDLLTQKTLERTSFPPIKDFFGVKETRTGFEFWDIEKKTLLQDTLIIENDLKKALAKNISGPVFFFSHCMMPHPPYVVDSLGRLSKSVAKSGYDPDGYIQQSVYMRSIILKWIRLIQQNAKRPYVIIVQGDHGYRYFPNELNKKECFYILNAMYYSDKDYGGLYNSISSVNTYRVLLNKYFGTRLPLLRDTSYYPTVYHLP